MYAVCGAYDSMCGDDMYVVVSIVCGGYLVDGVYAV